MNHVLNFVTDRFSRLHNFSTQIVRLRRTEIFLPATRRWKLESLVPIVCKSNHLSSGMGGERTMFVHPLSLSSLSPPLPALSLSHSPFLLFLSCRFFLFHLPSVFSLFCLAVFINQPEPTNCTCSWHVRYRKYLSADSMPLLQMDGNQKGHCSL